jgi:O-antigen/teichoic acid export membrane protein
MMASIGSTWKFSMTAERWRQLWYVPLLVVAMGLMFFRMLIQARLLGLDQFAAYSGGLLVSSTFSMLGCLGLQSMLQRDLPIFFVQGRQRRGMALIAQCLLIAIFCAALGMGAAATGVPLAPFSSTVVATGVVHGLSQQAFMVVTVESRSRGEPVRFSIQNFSRALGVLCLGVMVSKVFGSAILSLIAETSITLLIVATILYRMFERVPFGIFSAAQVSFRRLPFIAWRSAAALLAVGIVGFVVANLDRWLAADFLDKSLFAQYSFAAMILMVAQSLHVVINASAYPLLARRYASFGRVTAFSISMRASIILLAVGTVSAVLAWFILDRGIAYWFPAYTEARHVLPLFLAIAVLRLSDFWSSFMVIAGREATLLRLNVIATVTAVALWFVVAYPWLRSGVTVLMVALLAALLTLTSYLLTAFYAWRGGAS